MTKSTASINVENPAYSTLKSINPKLLISGALLVTLLASSGCATSSLLESGNQVVTTQSTKNILSEDQIVAFGRPAQALPKMPNATMVIVGEKNSYVLTKGAPRW